MSDVANPLYPPGVDPNANIFANDTTSGDTSPNASLSSSQEQAAEAKPGDTPSSDAKPAKNGKSRRSNTKPPIESRTGNATLDLANATGDVLFIEDSSIAAFKRVTVWCLAHGEFKFGREFVSTALRSGNVTAHGYVELDPEESIATMRIANSSGGDVGMSERALRLFLHHLSRFLKERLPAQRIRAASLVVRREAPAGADASDWSS